MPIVGSNNVIMFDLEGVVEVNASLLESRLVLIEKPWGGGEDTFRLGGAALSSDVHFESKACKVFVD